MIKSIPSIAIGIAILLSLRPLQLASGAEPGPAVGDTQIARWKDNKQGAFSMMFDDSVPTDIKNVVPELQKRKLIGVFYVNPGAWGWKKEHEAWEKTMPTLPGVVFGNHTMTHKGAHNVEELDKEVRLCNEVINNVVPATRSRLVSFGRPGVPKENWTVTDDEIQSVLKKYNLVLRPNSGAQMAMLSVKSPDQMLHVVDKAMAQGGYAWICFHGVGGDWIVTPMDIFTQFLDGLETRRSHVWITDHISIYQYETERNSGKVEVISAVQNEIHLRLSTQADPKLFDAPLTLRTRVPADWQQCQVTQGKAATVVAAQAGVVQFDALPGEEAIVLQKAKPASP